MPSAIRVTLAVLICAAGCDDTAKNKAAADKAAADKAKADEDAKTKAAVAERKAKREAEFKAKEEAKKNLESELERLCAVPEKMPKKAPGCEEVGQAHDAFIRRVGGAEAVAAWDAGGKDKAIPMTVVQCTQADSTKVAVCQKHALDGAGEGLKDYTKELLQTCIDKFGKGGGAPAAAVPKKRPG